jgi:hypothetical protein
VALPKDSANPRKVVGNLDFLPEALRSDDASLIATRDKVGGGVFPISKPFEDGRAGRKNDVRQVLLLRVR